MENQKKIYIVDTFALLFRAYYAVPALYNRNDFPTNMITGFFKTLSQLQKSYSLHRTVFALEGGGKNFRVDVNTQYKGNRGSAPENFTKQATVVIEWLREMGYTTLQEERFEADDAIASLSSRASELGYRVYIISPDKDFNQLLSDSITVIKPDKKGNFIDFGSEECFEKFGVLPHQFIDYQALVGDASDNVSGVEGVGAVTAKKLLNTHGSLDKIYSNLENIPAGTRKKLANGRNSAYQSQKLVTLYRDIYNGDSVDIESMMNPHSEPLMQIVDTLIEYEISDPVQYLLKNGLIDKNYIEEREKAGVEFDVNVITNYSDFKNILDSIDRDDEVVAFDTETTGLNQFEDKIVGFSIALNDYEGYYMPIGHNSMMSMFDDQMSMEDAKKCMELLSEYKIAGHNIKFDLHIVWTNFGVELRSSYDTMVISWLINPEGTHSLDYLAYRVLKHKTKKFSDIVPKGETFASVDIKEASVYAVEDAVITYALLQDLYSLTAPQDRYLQEIEYGEFPNILFKMEREGIAVDTDGLKVLKKETEKEIAKITEKIYDISGEPINLNSPKQLSNLLYNRLEIESSSSSTAEDQLQKIADQHEIVGLILSYRESFKLLSTYIEPLIKFGERSGRINTSFLQTGTATGRLSSREPNLQNIPVKRESGQKLRSLFVAGEGKKLLSIDYSQIELRLLAHYSEEPSLTEAFRSGKDVHTIVAERIGTDRRTAKTVNFGLLYGMGAKKLATTLSIGDSEAKEVLHRYFEEFSGLKSYYEKFTESVLQRGFVETVLGRRRYFSPTSKKEIEATKRESFNTLFQGSTADLIKVAMLSIDAEIDNSNFDAKMLLQIHDELLFEVAEDQLEEFRDSAIKLMESAIEFSIPIVAKSRSGSNWRDLQ